MSAILQGHARIITDDSALSPNLASRCSSTTDRYSNQARTCLAESGRSRSTRAFQVCSDATLHPGAIRESRFHSRRAVDQTAAPNGPGGKPSGKHVPLPSLSSRGSAVLVFLPSPSPREPMRPIGRKRGREGEKAFSQPQARLTDGTKRLATRTCRRFLLCRPPRVATHAPDRQMCARAREKRTRRLPLHQPHALSDR